MKGRSGSSQSAGGGNVAGPPPANPSPPAANEALVERAIDVATDALLNYECWSMFGNSGTRETMGFNPSEVLQYLNQNGLIKFEYHSDSGGELRSL